MDSTSKAQIKKIDRAIAKGQDAVSGVAELIEEKRLFDQLASRQGPGAGWQLVTNEGEPFPMRRIAFVSLPLAELYRNFADGRPLVCRIFEYSGVEWCEQRSVIHLTDEELASRPVYRDLYEALVAEGKAPRRDIVETDPGEEPSGGELYRIAKALKEGLARFPYPSDIQRRAGILYSSIITGGTASEILDRAFRFHEGPSILFVLAEMAQVVPEVGRLVAWLEHGEAA